MKYYFALAIPLVPICLTNPVSAQETPPQATTENQELNVGFGIPETFDLQGYIGVSVGLSPTYQGSDEVSTAGLPLINIRQEDFLFIQGASVNPNDGYGSIGWNALNFGYGGGGERKFGLSVGPMIRFNVGRDEDGNSALKGLGDINDSIGSGGFIEARTGNWFADVSAVSQDTGVADGGLSVALRSGYTIEISERLSITPIVYSSWGNDDYMQGFYGVNSTQATRSGLAQYNAEAGFKDVGFQIGMTYSMSEKFLINGQIGYQRLLNDAADSPIVDNNSGSSDQFRALIGIAYKF